MARQTLAFTYWSDPLCVWAFVAQKHLADVLARGGEDLQPVYRIVPVFGSVPQRFRDGAWAEAGPAGRAEVTARVAREHGHPEVTGRVWIDDPPATTWLPSAAVKAAQALEASGAAPEGAAARFLWALRVALFVDDRNTARRRVVLDVAESAALDPDAVAAGLDDGTALAALFEDHQERDRQRVQGSPTYVLDGGRAMLYGNFDASVLHATVDRLLLGLQAHGSAC